MRLAPENTPLPWHALRPDETARRLEADPIRGPSEAEARRRPAVYGPNRLPEDPPSPFWQFPLDQFADLLVGLPVAAAVLTVILGDWTDTIAIRAIVALNAVAGAVRERRAAGALEALRAFAPRSRTRMLPGIGLGSNWRLAAVAFPTLAFQALALGWAPRGGFLQMDPLPWATAAWLGLVSPVPVTLPELWKPLRRVVRSRTATA
jgi:hypothetical protein